MSFRPNGSTQLCFTDTFTNLTPRAKKFMENSWAQVFADEVFPYIDEEIFRVLYSDKASRPNTPVNVIVGGLLLKELLGLSDDELLENLILDPRYQYALHTTSCREQPMSDKTLQRFRRRCVEYEEETGVDLIHECVAGLSERIAKLMGITNKVKRMDSMMIEANIRRLSRTELLYQCVSHLVQRMKKDSAAVPEAMQHYLEPEDYNRTFYYKKSEDAEGATDTILHDAWELLARTELSGTKEYQLLERCFREQAAVQDDTPRLRTKEDGGMDSSILQNPSDPDATYRKKAGKEYRGYAANLEESVGEQGSVVTDYQFEQNNYSDQQFIKDSIARKARQEEKVTIVADGAYDGQEIQELAAQKNIDLRTTSMTGRLPDESLADCVLSEDETSIGQCPAGNKPVSVSWQEKSGTIKADFIREQCANCPNRDKCRAKVYKTKSVVRLTTKSYRRARQMKSMKEEEYRNYARLRNGVETVPSSLRRNYAADRMPVRGLLRSRLVFGMKIAALNVGKLLTHRRRGGNYAQNPVLAGC